MIARLHVARLFGAVMLGTMAGACGVWLVIDFADGIRLYSGEGWLAAVLELYACKLATVAWQLAPAAAAIAAALATSALRRTGEVTALRALGHGPGTFAWPVGAVALFAGGLLTFAEDPVVVPATYRAEELTAKRFHRWGDYMLYHRHRSWFMGEHGRVFDLEIPDGRGFRSVTIYELDESFRLRRRMDAARIDPAGPGRWRLEDATVRVFAEGEPMRQTREAERFENFPEDLSLFRVRAGRPTQMRRAELPEQIFVRRRLGLPSLEWELTLHERRAYQLAGVPAALLGAALALRPGRRGHVTAALAEGGLVTAGMFALAAVARTFTLAGHLPAIVGGWASFAAVCVGAALALWRLR